MAKSHDGLPIVLRWSEHVPASDVQDPLGLGLRGSARLASQLLYCITSITPRARYFSFIPWCIHDFQRREKGLPHATGLRDGLVLREQVLTLACIAHHKGEPCEGGALVGSRSAKKWFEQGNKVANFKKLKKFSKNPALGAYLNSLVNLGFFVTEEQRPDSDEEVNTDKLTFEDIELSPLGLDVAKRYESVTGKLAATKHIIDKDRTFSLSTLAAFGKHGGLCELSNGCADDRELLRDIFFAVTGSSGESHRVRRRSLLLTLDLCRQLGTKDWVLDEPEFAAAVYYGVVDDGESHFDVSVPTQLLDICTRWRMFYFHHYMAVALEGLFSWLVSTLGGYGLAGATINSLVARLDEATVRRSLREILQVKFDKPFGAISPAALYSLTGLPQCALDEPYSEALDDTISSMSPFAEDTLEEIIRSNGHLYSSTGLAIPLILLATTLGRFARWETTNYGKWLAGVADPNYGYDPFLDLIPPLVSVGLTRRFGDWWQCSWKELASFILSRYVVQQHQSMSFEKTSTGDRCLIQKDGDKLISTGGYTKIGMGNPRLGSAIQVLQDLGLTNEEEDEVRRLTPEGKQFLKQELAKEGKNEVS